jgi:hypothetical protein
MAESAVNAVKNAASNAFQNVTHLFTSGASGSNGSSGPKAANNTPVSKNVSSLFSAAAATPNIAPGSRGIPISLTAITVLAILLFGLVLIFTSFRNEVVQGYEYVLMKTRAFLGYSTDTSVDSEVTPTSGSIRELTKPVADLTKVPPKNDSIVERILPIPGDGNEVFNVNQNKYTYYDAEPLCKALGAELATYDQVKAAWENGADWCNYGWVKGQMAVYPTQQRTYESLQGGAADQQGACGTVGINGGHFDNPDLEYGVNCYGKKPGQTAPLSTTVPQTPDMLEFNKKVSEFKHDADSMKVSPFNGDKWSNSKS